MSQESVKNVKKTDVSSLESCGNVVITNHDFSTNDKNNINIQINNVNKSPNDLSTTSTTTKNKINCLPLAIELLHLVFPTNVEINPILTHNYKTVIIEGYKTKPLEPNMHKMFEQLGLTLIDIKFLDCDFDVMTLYDILCKLPLLESLQLSMKLSMDMLTEFDENRLPELLHFKDMKLEINADIIEYILYMTTNVSTIEVLAFLNSTLNINQINDFLKHHQNLKSLNLTKCIINKLPSIDYTIFNCLKQLHTLELFEVNDEMLTILKSTCIDGLQELSINYTTEQNKNAIRIIDGWNWNKEQHCPLKQRRNRLFTIENGYGLY